MASQLAIVRGLAEQLTVSQKKMAQDIAALETAKENLSQKMWWLYQSSAFDAPPSQASAVCKNSLQSLTNVEFLAERMHSSAYSRE
jgi:hypothetical protein